MNLKDNRSTTALSKVDKHMLYSIVGLGKFAVPEAASTISDVILIIIALCLGGANSFIFY